MTFKKSLKGDLEEKKKDKRYLVRVNDEKMAKDMQKTMMREGLSQQEYLDRYMRPHMPKEDYDIPYEHYQKFSEHFYLICLSSKLKNDVKEILGIFWAIMMKIYMHQLDSKKVLDALDRIPPECSFTEMSLHSECKIDIHQDAV